MSNDKEAFIKRVRETRKKSGLTQAEIAKELGIDRDTYKQYELRSYLPNKLIPKFCEVIGLRKEWLVDGTGPMIADPKDKRVQRLYDHLSSMSDEKLKALEVMIGMTDD